jgi:hypothetical protein
MICMGALGLLTNHELLKTTMTIRTLHRFFLYSASDTGETFDAVLEGKFVAPRFSDR